MQGTHRKERISRLRGRALELETKLEGLSKSLLLKPGLYMAMSDREANAPNELSMQKFQSLRVIMIYSDGWGHCVNEDTGEEGVVPLSCLKSMDGFQVSELTDSDHTLVKEKKLLKKLSISDDILVKEPGIYTCVQDRLAERVNEISLEKGNQVRVLMVFSDGWGLCLDDSTGQQGIAPLNILKLQGFNLDPIQEQRNQSSKSLGYYRVLVDRIPIQPNEVLLLRGNVVQVLTIYSDGWCHCMNIDTLEAGDCPFNVLEWIEDQSLSKDLKTMEKMEDMMVESVHGLVRIQENDLDNSLYKSNRLRSGELHPILEVSDDPESEKDVLGPVRRDFATFEEQTVSIINQIDTKIKDPVAAIETQVQVTESITVGSTSQLTNLIDFNEELNNHVPKMESIDDFNGQILDESDTVPADKVPAQIQSNDSTLIKTEDKTIFEDIVGNIPLEDNFHISNPSEGDEGISLLEEISKSSTTLKPVSTDNVQNQMEKSTPASVEAEGDMDPVAAIETQVQATESIAVGSTSQHTNLIDFNEELNTDVPKMEILEDNILLDGNIPISDSTEGDKEMLLVEKISETIMAQNYHIAAEMETKSSNHTDQISRTDSILQSESAIMTAETITKITSHIEELTVFSASIDNIQGISEISLKKMDTLNLETDSDVTLSHAPSFEKYQQELQSIFDSADAILLENGLKFIEIKSSSTIEPHFVPVVKKPFISTVREKLPQDSQDVISILRLIRMISIFLLALQFLGFVCYSLVNTFLILKNQITSIMPVTFTTQDIYIWLKYIFIEILEIDRFPVVAGNTLALIALIATVWEGVLIGFVNQIML